VAAPLREAALLYLLDANVLITAHNTYYPVDTVPEFWDWVLHHANLGSVKMPLEIYEEIKDGGTDDEKDLLFGWAVGEGVKEALVLKEEVDAAHVAKCISAGYAPDLTDDQLLQVGRDPFLMAYAMASPEARCVVTNEVSAPTKTRQNRRIPDVCSTLGLNCCSTFVMLKALGFKTGWNKLA
jgi:hypothetical protein